MKDVQEVDKTFASAITTKTVKKSKNILRNILMVAAAVAIFTGGWGVGSGKVSLNSASNLAEVIADDKPADLSTDGIQEVYDELKKNYDGTVDTSKLLDGLKKGTVAAVGDPYTEYFSKEETTAFNEDLNGTFEGIGAELGKEGEFVVIIAPIKGAPAEKAGVLPHDIITEIDGQSATGITVAEAVKRIRGEKDTTVKLKLIRDGEEVEVSIVRDTIDIPSVEWKNESGIGIITISRFGDDTVSLTQKAAKDLSGQGVKKVVLDLRGNPGGLLDAAVGVSGIWLPEDSVVLEEKRGGETIQTFKTTNQPVFGKDVKTVILIDQGSASASEIVAGALHDHGIAKLYGVKSYGKGSVQQLIDLSGGSSLKVTIARWYTPNGKNIDKEGIEPDTKIERTSEDRKANRDPQMDAAKKAF